MQPGDNIHIYMCHRTAFTRNCYVPGLTDSAPGTKYLDDSAKPASIASIKRITSLYNVSF